MKIKTEENSTQIHDPFSKDDFYKCIHTMFDTRKRARRFIWMVIE